MESVTPGHEVNAVSTNGSAQKPMDSLPRVWNLPARNPGFTGRDALLAAVREELTVADRAVVQAFNGMGGVGKTQLALEYAHRHVAAYEVVWWVDSEQPSLIGVQFAALGSALECVEPGAAIDVVRSAVLGKLRGRGRWLLVFDNAQAPADVRPWLPGGDGHVLITSRHRADGMRSQSRLRSTFCPGLSPWRCSGAG